MANVSGEQEKDAIDFVTDCMYAISYLETISRCTFDDNQNHKTLKQFYVEWIQVTKSPRKIIPFNPGIFLGYLYVGILYTKENWFDLLPEDPLEGSDESWGLKNVTPHAPKKTNLTVKYVIKRIRNSLGHGHPIISIPEEIKPGEFFTKINFSFHDINIKDSSDTFDIVLSLDQLTKLIKKFQSVIHKFVREKK